MTSTTPISVERIGHVVLNVSDLERAVAFYREVLGLREVGRYGAKMVFFSASGANHHDLALYDVGPEARRPGAHDVGLSHVALKIGDTLETLRAAKAHLDATGVAIRRMENHRVSQSIYLADPDGNEIELYVDDDPGIWRNDPAAVASVQPLTL